jgi:hypothetical protein
MQICTDTAATGINQRLKVLDADEAETSPGFVSMTQASQVYFFFPLVNHSAQRCGGKQKSVMMAIRKNNTTTRKKRAKCFS